MGEKYENNEEENKWEKIIGSFTNVFFFANRNKIGGIGAHQSTGRESIRIA